MFLFSVFDFTRTDNLTLNGLILIIKFLCKLLFLLSLLFLLFLSL
jgi:hypothetical protein